jgi:hypothetical protein
MKSFPIVVAALLATAGLTACGGPSDPEDLAEQVVESLKDGELQTYIDDLVATPQEVLDVCPAVSSYRVDQAEQQQHFNECLAHADFHTAKVTQALPTLVTDPICSAGVTAAQEIRVTVSTDTAIYTFTIDGALETKDGWKVTGKLKCPAP